MRMFIGLLCLSFVLVGCQSREENKNTQNASEEISQERKEASTKLTEISIDLLKQEKLKEAIESLSKAIGINPKNQDPYLLLGQILIKSGEYQRAVQLLDGAAKILPDNGMIFYMLSVSNKMTGQKLPAALAARRSLEIFKAANDKENSVMSMALFQDILKMPDQPTANAQ